VQFFLEMGLRGMNPSTANGCHPIIPLEWWHNNELCSTEFFYRFFPPLTFSILHQFVGEIVYVLSVVKPI
jgi:hypothetical protein